MKLRAVALAAGLFGGLGTLCFLLAFGTDYWLLASDGCEGYGPLVLELEPGKDRTANATVEAAPSLTLHHEGFFWRCSFQAEPSLHTAWAVLFTNQPETKECIHGYLFPFPVAVGPVPHPIYDPTAVFRGFWTLLIVLGVVCALVGGFLLVCAVPFLSPKLYRLGGEFLVSAACLFLILLVLYILWVELVDVQRYVLQERGDTCHNAQVSVFYGWSFILAGAGVPLELLAGLLFLLLGRHLQASQ